MAKLRKTQLARIARDLYRSAYHAHLTGRHDQRVDDEARLWEGLDPVDVIRLDPLFRRDVRWFRPRPTSILGKIFFPQQADGSSAVRILIHSPHGDMREKAVMNIASPETDEMALAALFVRANDWVEPVRNAAMDRLATAIPKVDSEVLQRFVPIILERVSNWKRGGARILDLVEARGDWSSILANTFLNETSGPLARHLREVLEKNTLDDQLVEFATEARSSFVRQVAAEAVLTRRARWQTGVDYEWIDKPMNLRRKVAVFSTRDLPTSENDRLRVLRLAAQDKSAQVRKLAADVLIRDGLGDGEIERLLSADAAPSVRSRLEFAQRKWAEEGAAKAP